MRCKNLILLALVFLGVGFLMAYGQEPVWDEYGAPQIRELLELKEISQQRSDQIEERIAEIEEFAGTN